MVRKDKSVVSAFEGLQDKIEKSKQHEQQRQALVQKACKVRDSGTWRHEGSIFVKFMDGDSDGGEVIPHIYLGTNFVPIHSRGIEITVRELSGRNDPTVTHLLVRKKEGEENQSGGSSLASFYLDGSLEVHDIEHVDESVLDGIDSLLTFIEESPHR